jgi:hypothetical protein
MFDFDEGVMTLTAPKQVIAIENLDDGVKDEPESRRGHISRTGSGLSIERKKSKKINYDFYNMNSFFSAWVDRGDFVSQSYYNGQNPYIWKLENDKVMIQKNINYDNKLSRDNDLPNVLPMFTSKIGEIDFKYWWFYNKNGYRFGGIDEYTLDNFDWYGYSVYIQPTHQNQIPAFNNHPSEWVYVMLSNYAMKHNNFMTVSKKYQSYLLNKIKEEIENPTDDNYLINPIIRHWKS